MKKFLSFLTVLLYCLFIGTGMISACSETVPGPADIVITEESGGTFRPLPIDLSGGASLGNAVYSADMTIYQDPSIRVERHRVTSTEWGCYYYYAMITLRDPSQLRTASADDTFVTSAKMPVSRMARRKNAVLAVNGDFCAAFSGNKANNYILRQGTVFRDTVAPKLDMLLIDEDGDFHILTADQDLESLDKTQIDGKKIVNALQFGPALVIDGEKVPDEIVLDPAHAPDYAEPRSRATQRMCIAQIDKLHYMVLCTAHPGIDLAGLRDLAMSLADCRIVYNLDGGASTQMVFLYQKINNVIKGGNGEEIRDITDIIYFASAWFQE